MPGQYFGKYTGVVQDNRDPEHRGRLQVTVEAIFPSGEVVTAVPAVPYGFFFVPENKAKVWIEFEGGDTGFPLWTGVQYLQGEWRPEADADPPQKRVLKTAAGHVMVFNDKSGEAAITLTDGSNKHVVTLNKDGIAVTDGVNKHELTLSKAGIAVKDGANKHELTLDGSGVTVTVSGGAKIQVTAQGVTVDAGAGKVDVKGSLINLSAAAALPVLRVSDTGIGNLGAPVPLIGPGNPQVLG